ncbi:MAG: sodium:solute symporter [Bacteroidaceae bacterium]|nr:sodium:solute symporter [Bacteroidaceae bacterium]
MLITFFIYFLLLLLVSRLVRRDDNDAFFRGNRQSPWFLVAFGMVGASFSGVTFIGVPGMVMNSDMTYLQMCIGFFFGYLIVAFVLLPLYYRLELTSIYSYLDKRLGRSSYKTGAWFFIISKLSSSAAKFYVVCLVLQQFVFDALGIPYCLTAVVTLGFIWMYTHKSGIKALVWTDALQTFCLIVALVMIMFRAADMLGMSLGEAVTAVVEDSHSRVFEFSDFVSRQNFWKQFLSGVFVVIVMTGLDQDMMQKNLTCRDLKSAQKDMCSYGVLFIPVNALFLSLGVLLMMLYSKMGISLPESGDELLTGVAASGVMGDTVVVLFTIGVIASAFSSADSALTALSTSFCIDILGFGKGDKTDEKKEETTRRYVHIVMTAIFLLFTLVFKWIGSSSVIDLIYTLVSYTYGPLLGLFAFGIFTNRTPQGKFVPYIAVLSPVVCYLVDYFSLRIFGYKFGYELLMLNGLLTFVGLWTVSKREMK